MKKKIGETSYKETALGILPRSRLILLEVEGTKRAWDFIMEKFKNKNAKLNLGTIQKVHQIGFGWIFPEIGGEFRKIEVLVSKHTPPKFYLIPQLMIDFMNDLCERIKYLPKLDNVQFVDEVTGLLSWAHHRFLWIHPFQDYNGRIGRLLNNIILLKLDLPPIELKVETDSGRKKYIDALQKADLGNYIDLNKIIRSAIEEAIEEIDLLS